jgi:hypothetical protein
LTTICNKADCCHFPLPVQPVVCMKIVFMKKINWLVLIFIIIIAGCTTSQITTSWKADNVSPKKYDKILVLGLIGEPDRTIRENMEQHMAGDLMELGYNAVTSMQEYGPKAFENMKEAEALKLLYDKGIDAVVTIVLLDKEKEKYYVPGRVRYSPYVVYQRRFWGYYSTMYDRIYAPGYYATDTKYFWETNFYDLNDWTLLYSAQSQSFEPGTTQSLAHEYGLMIVKDMVKNNLLQKQAPVLKSF